MVTEEMTKDREEDLLREYRVLLKQRIIPTMFMPEGIAAAIDLALAVDRRKLVVQVLKEIVVSIEQSIAGVSLGEEEEDG